MTPQQFEALLRSKMSQIDQALKRDIPIKVGRRAADLFKQNFQLSGYQNGGLHPWPKTRRQLQGGSAAFFQRGPLLSGSDHLKQSITYVPANRQVTVGTSVPYAATHNQGATINVTPAMRAHMWKMYYQEIGSAKTRNGRKAESDKARMWKAMALGLKKKKTITIPQRQFLGDSPELRSIVTTTLEQELTRIITQ